jgi:hypothetical protein
MEITELERAQIIIDVLKTRLFQKEEELLSEQVAHQLTKLSYQKREAVSTPEPEPTQAKLPEGV